MKSTWNRTCFPNPPGCCMYRLPYEQVGPDIKGSRWVAFLLSVSWNWHLHTASGQRARAYLVYFTLSWRWLPSMFVFGTIEDTPNIIRTGCNWAGLSVCNCRHIGKWCGTLKAVGNTDHTRQTWIHMQTPLSPLAGCGPVGEGTSGKVLNWTVRSLNHAYTTTTILWYFAFVFFC